MHILPFLTTAFLVSAVPAAHALMVYELEAAALNGLPLAGSNTPKALTVMAGDVIDFRLYVDVTGASGNPALEGLQRGTLSLTSSASGGISANFLSTFLFSGPFGSPSFPGVLQDFDGDLDVDLGSTSTSSTADYIRTGNTVMVTSGTPILDGTRFVFGTVSVGVAAAIPFSSVSVAPVVPDFISPLNDISRAQYMLDGVTYNGTAFGGPVVGQPVILNTVPEPSGSVLLGGAILTSFALGRRNGTRMAS